MVSLDTTWPTWDPTSIGIPPLTNRRQWVEPFVMGYGFFWLPGHDVAIAHLNDDRLTTVGADRGATQSYSSFVTPNRVTIQKNG